MKISFYTLYILSVLLNISSCKNEKNSQLEANSIEKTVSTDTLSSLSCPYLTKDNKGNITLSWVKEINDTTAVMCYAVSTDKGKTFGNPVEVLPSTSVHPHGENLPKIIFKPSGEIIAMWGASNPNPESKYSGLIYYAQSFDGGKNWSGATELVTDTSAYDQRYFDMDLLANGEVMVIWLDNRGRKEKEGSTLYCASTDGKNGFKNENAIGETCCQCCRTDLFIDSKGIVHASYRDIINDSIRDMVHLISYDNGHTFTSPVRISADNWVINGCPHTGPTETENKNGLHFAWYTMGGNEGVFYCNSRDFGKTFSARDTVSRKASAKHPQIISLPNDHIAIVWDETVRNGDDANARIGLQIRNPDGKIHSTQFISADDTIAEFPVITATDDGNILVAFKQRTRDKTTVLYKRIQLNEKVQI